MVGYFAIYILDAILPRNGVSRITAPDHAGQADDLVVPRAPFYGREKLGCTPGRLTSATVPTVIRFTLAAPGNTCVVRQSPGGGQSC